MRPPKVGKFMKWRDEQPEYQEAMREVLKLTDEAEVLEAQGIESHPSLDEWERAKEKLLAVERALLVQYEARQSG